MMELPLPLDLVDIYSQHSIAAAFGAVTLGKGKSSDFQLVDDFLVPYVIAGFINDMVHFETIEENYDYCHYRVRFKEEILEWVENNIGSYNIKIQFKKGDASNLFIDFENDDDLLLFKMRWL